MNVRGIRGAVQVERDDREAILKATEVMVRTILEENHVRKEDIAAVFFTATGDLKAEFPAYAARQLGLNTTAILCAREMDVPGAMGHLLRTLVLVNTEKSSDEIRHVYLGKAKSLRPDLFPGSSEEIPE